MALTFIKASTLPQMQRGFFASTVLGMTVRDNGQIALNATLAAKFEGKKFVAPASDGETGKFPITVAFLPVDAPPKGWEEKDLFPILRNNKGKSKNVVISASRLFKQIGYDYKGSGTQKFEAVETPAGKDKVAYSFVLKSATLTPPTTEKRTRRTKEQVAAAKAAKAASAAGKANGSGVDTPAPTGTPSAPSPQGNAPEAEDIL